MRSPLAGAGLYGLIGFLMWLAEEFGEGWRSAPIAGQIVSSVFGYSVRLVLISSPLGLARHG